MVFSYEGGAISPTSRAKSFNSSHRSNFCTSRILWKPWRCWRGSWVKAKARELATCGLSAFGRKPPGSGPMPLPCFIVLRNSFWAWCWARQCAIWQLCVRRPNLGSLALQELLNSIPVKSLYRKMELWGAAVDEASFNTAFRTMQDWAGRLAFSSVEPCHLSPVEHVALRPWGCPRFSTTNLIGVKKRVFALQFANGVVAKVERIQLPHLGPEFLTGVLWQEEWDMFFVMSWTLYVCEPSQVPGLGWVSFDVWDSCCDFGGPFLFGFVGHVTTTWHTGVTTAAMPREMNVNISLPMYEYQIYMYKYVYTCINNFHNFCS